MAFSIQPASRSESKEQAVQLETLFTETPELGERCQDFTADRGLDSTALKQDLWDQHQILPLVDTVKHWQEEKKAPDYNPESIVTSHSIQIVLITSCIAKKGEVFCVCPETREQRQLRNLIVGQSFGFEHHYIRGKTKMQVRVDLAMAIMMALALGHVQEGRPEQMQSLVKPVPLLDTG